MTGPLEDFLERDSALSGLFDKGEVAGHPALVIAGATATTGAIDLFSVSRSESHGGFDNDPDTLNSILRRILQPKDGVLKRMFQTRDLQY